MTLRSRGRVTDRRDQLIGGFDLVGGSRWLRRVGGGLVGSRLLLLGEHREPGLRRDGDRLGSQSGADCPSVDLAEHPATPWSKRYAAPRQGRAGFCDVGPGAVRLARPPGHVTTASPRSSTRRLMDCGLPAQGCRSLLRRSDSAASRNARATSVTYTKSRRCVPSPTTVSGLPAQLLLEEHAEHRTVSAGGSRARVRTR